MREPGTFYSSDSLHIEVYDQLAAATRMASGSAADDDVTFFRELPEERDVVVGRAPRRHPRRGGELVVDLDVEAVGRVERARFAHRRNLWATGRAVNAMRARHWRLRDT